MFNLKMPGFLSGTTKGQASTEMIATLGVIIAFTLPVVLLFFSMTQIGQDETSKAQAQATARSLADTMNKLYAMGPGAKRTMYVNLPPTTESVRVENNEVIITIRTSEGTFEAASSTIAKENKNYNEITERAGLVPIYLEIDANGGVEMHVPKPEEQNE